MSGDWNLTQAWAWIRWRVPAKVAAFAAESHLGLAEAVMYPDGSTIVEDDHRRALLMALQDGRLAVRGIAADAAAGAQAVAIPATDWAGLVPVAPSEARHVKGRKVAWRGLAFRQADLLRLWPAIAGSTTPLSLRV